AGRRDRMTPRCARRHAITTRGSRTDGRLFEHTRHKDTKRVSWFQSESAKLLIFINKWISNL
ncbi:MAG: hypothetical protein ABSG31_18130, partial [Tepidisphaeraceae bacterium]